MRTVFSKLKAIELFIFFRIESKKSAYSSIFPTKNVAGNMFFNPEIEWTKRNKYWNRESILYTIIQGFFGKKIEYVHNKLVF